ncbi:hypothetical protein PHLCEN_2v1387 [Hermanssonia centrifuga]|uniref:Uncharacterized protein n=1 Tax=Hermanssonia centrifuga TaxID=98765 RepID=A0A2R6S394_9APHY|nr:hypothetical protein PHLCEN_2v1387 [Hermanssonia centrifuga]
MSECHKSPILFIGGTGVLATEAKGMFPSTTIYDDQDVEQIEGLPDNAPHRHVDLTIVQADQQGYVRAHIVLPGTIWGIASNPLVAAGIQNPYSQQIPGLIRASLDRKQAGMVGKGLAIWPDVNIEDVANLYMKLFDTIMTKQDTVGHGREGFYFGENGEHTWYSISKEIASVLFQEGISQSDEPTSFSKEELIQYWGSEIPRMQAIVMVATRVAVQTDLFLSDGSQLKVQAT